MKEKSLKAKAISIKGKSYVLVSDRILYFNEAYPNGAIHSKIISYENGKVIIQAKIIPDAGTPDRFFLGLSQADESQGMVNKTSALENAETSAVGRALAMMGIGVLDSIASADEMAKAGVAGFSKPADKDSQICPEHNCSVPMRISKSGNPYWGCTAGGKMHFLKDPNQDEAPGQDSQFDNGDDKREEVAY